MTVVFSHSKALHLNLVECSGVVTTAQLGALVACAAENPALLRADALNIILPDADLSGVELETLSGYYARYQQAYAALEFQVYRRTGWICDSPSAEAHVAFWVDGNEARKAFATNTRRLATLAEAADWMLLNADEYAQLERREGFVELARFDDEPIRAAAAG